MASHTGEVDTGTAYGLGQPKVDPKFVCVGAGTPMGETLRRYWHPIAKISDANDTPRKVRLLGENLILFRDGNGNAGLVAELCCHRGASLFYGRVDKEGIRCCYHGWLFDHKGNCLNQPYEPNGGRTIASVRQPWYPVEERYGLIWAYMGPPEKKPLLPRWKHLEISEDSSDVLEVIMEPGWGNEEILPFNWLHNYENSADPFHVPWLHVLHSGVQFQFAAHLDKEAVAKTFEQGVTWTETDRGVVQASDSLTVEMVFPNLTFVPGFNDLMVHVPVDDNSCRLIQVARVKKVGEAADRHTIHNGKAAKDCTPEELQKYPGDGEALKDIPGAGHSWEHLATTDRGVVMLRRFWMRQVDKVLQGEDPAGVNFDPAAPLLETAACFNAPMPA